MLRRTHGTAADCGPRATGRTGSWKGARVSVWRSFFDWPSGGVWSNLLASLMWAAPAFTTHHVLMRRHTSREIDRQTQEIKAHMERTGTP